jgi:hypothetical protein
MIFDQPHKQKTKSTQVIIICLAMFLSEFHIMFPKKKDGHCPSLSPGHPAAGAAVQALAPLAPP